MLGPGVRTSPSATRAKANSDEIEGTTYSITKVPAHTTARTAGPADTRQPTLYRCAPCTAHSARYIRHAPPAPRRCRRFRAREIETPQTARPACCARRLFQEWGADAPQCAAGSRARAYIYGPIPRLQGQRTWDKQVATIYPAMRMR